MPGVIITVVMYPTRKHQRVVVNQSLTLYSTSRIGTGIMFFKTGMWKNTPPSGQKGHYRTHGTSEGPMSDVPFFVWAYPGALLRALTGLMPFDLAFWPNTG